MAGYEWNQIQAPNLSPITASQQLAAELLNKATSGASDALKGFRTDLQNQDNASLAAQLARVNTPQQLDSLSIPQYASPEAIAAISARRDAMMESALKQQDATSRNNYYQASIDKNKYELQEQQQTDQANALANRTINFNGQNMPTAAGIVSMAGGDVNQIDAAIGAYASTNEAFKNASPEEQAKVVDILRKQASAQLKASDAAVQSGLGTLTAMNTLEQGDLTLANQREVIDQKHTDQLIGNINNPVVVEQLSQEVNPTKRDAELQKVFDTFVANLPEQSRQYAKSKLNDVRSSIMSNVEVANKQYDQRIVNELTSSHVYDVGIRKFNEDPTNIYDTPEELQNKLNKLLPVASGDPRFNAADARFRQGLIQGQLDKQRNLFNQLTVGNQDELKKENLTPDEQSLFVREVLPDPSMLSTEEYARFSDNKTTAVDQFFAGYSNAKEIQNSQDPDALVKKLDQLKSALASETNGSYKISKIPDAVFGEALKRSLRSSGVLDDAEYNTIAKAELNPAIQYIKNNFDPNGEPSKVNKQYNTELINRSKDALNYIKTGRDLNKLNTVIAGREASGRPNDKLIARRDELRKKLESKQTETTSKEPIKRMSASDIMKGTVSPTKQLDAVPNEVNTLILKNMKSLGNGLVLPYTRGTQEYKLAKEYLLTNYPKIQVLN